MSHSAEDPDDLVRKKVDLNHITKMSKDQIHRKSSLICRFSRRLSDARAGFNHNRAQSINNASSTSRRRSITSTHGSTK